MQVTLLSTVLFTPNSCRGITSPHLPASVGKEQLTADNPPGVRCSVGIDVSKGSFDIFVDSCAEECRVANQAADIDALVVNPEDVDRASQVHRRRPGSK
jgi:phosphopantetheine adenylyltransferase